MCVTVRMLKGSDWNNILNYLKLYPNIRIGKEKECRVFVEGVLWLLRTGAQWRKLPPEYGKWNSVYKRFSRWSDAGVWRQMHTFFSQDPDMENLFIDGSVVRAHPCAAGACRARGGQAAQAPGRSRGGFTTKIHAAADALGQPLRFMLTGGQRHDSTRAIALTEGFKYKRAICDKAYDFDEFIEHIIASGAEPVIPSRSNRCIQREYDRHIYKERYLVECLFSKLKNFRRIFSRFDKLADRYLSFLHFGAVLIWLR